MAYNLEAPWLAVFVETSAMPWRRPSEQQLAQNLELVRSLGGEVVTAAGDDVAAALLRLAQQRNATQIVVGKPLHVHWWRLLGPRTVVDQLIGSSDDIDIYVVVGEEQAARRGVRPTAPVAPRQSSWHRYLLSALIVFAVTVLLLALFVAYPWFGYQAAGLLELFVVLLIAVYLGRGPALLAALVSAISWNFLFITPRFTFAISSVEDVILFFLYFLIALLAGNLTARLRQQERLARYNAERTAALYTLAHDTATAVNMDDVLHTAADQIGRVFDAEVAILLSKDNRLERQPHKASTLVVDEKVLAVAAWVFENGKRAGRYTETLPQAVAQCLPLRTSNRTVGVLGIQMRQDGPPAFDQELLLETFANQVALVIERELLDEAAEHALMLRESERLYTALLNSISHELRTPIATITGAASLLDSQTNNDPQLRGELTRDIQSAADRLNRLVANLLDMSRLDAGRLKLKLDWCDVGDVIGVAAQRVHGRLTQHPLTIRLVPNLSLVQMDFVLMEQVLVNLLDNACNYTPPGAPITVEARVDRQQLQITVADGGPGIPPADLERIFDKFYRLPGSATGGTGLGLSICRGLVEAHGGALTAANTPSGGAQFTIMLPAGASPPPVKEATL
jgi:two-component system sensor histidine kinase KdpD